MKALAIRIPGELAFLEAPERAPGEGEAGLAVDFIGYCGSDLNSYRGLNPLVSFPRVPGHEISARVAALGPGVDGLAVGQRVTVYPYFNCGTCRACRIGRANACLNNQTMGVQREGALVERVCLPVGKIVPLEGVSARDAALVEPLSVGFHAVRRGAATSGETVVVLGSGVIGLGATLGALHAGARVIAVDLSAQKLEVARKLGAAHGIDASKEDVAARVAELTGGEGAELVIEAVGTERTFRQSIDLAAQCGRVVYVGYAKNPVSYETRFFVQKEIDIRGSRNAERRDFDEVAAYLRAHPEAGDLIVTRIAPMAEAAQAMRDWDARPGDYTKIMIDVSGQGG